jgi:hypothetical protein
LMTAASSSRSIRSVEWPLLRICDRDAFLGILVAVFTARVGALTAGFFLDDYNFLELPTGCGLHVVLPEWWIQRRQEDCHRECARRVSRQ